MFNLSGSELIFLLLMALVILGPEKLPDAIRRFGRTYAELKKVTTGFQTELKSAMDEPVREMRATADTLRSVIEGTTEDVKAAIDPLAAQTRATFSAAPPLRPTEADEAAAAPDEAAAPSDEPAAEERSE